MSREAQVVDVLRSFQRDDLAIRTLEENIQDFSKVLSSRTYRSYSKFIPYISSFWYYYVTSGNNLQTLGEEYSNIIRLSDNAIPNKLTQVLWLSLYIGGEPLLNRLISYIETQVKTSGELREEARLFLMKIFSFWHSYNSSLKTIHRALFYISGKYFSVSHRITGIKYVLLRNWLEDKTFTKSFEFLGNVSLIYCLFNVCNKSWNNIHEETYDKDDILNPKNEYSTKLCILCNEHRKNPSVTSCGHIFCWKCLHESLTYHRKCPVCREEVDPTRVIFCRIIYKKMVFE